MTPEEIELAARALHDTITYFEGAGTNFENDGVRDRTYLDALATAARLSVPSGDVAEDVEEIHSALRGADWDDENPAFRALARLVARLRRAEQKQPKDEPTPAENAAFDAGAEAMRAACWESIQRVCEEQGLTPFLQRFKDAIEGATP